MVEQENAKLHAQLATVTSQMTSLQRHFEGNPDASRSFSEEESRSAEQLMEIIKFLRREKEILTGKVEVLHAESARVRSQLEQGRSTPTDFGNVLGFSLRTAFIIMLLSCGSDASCLEV